MIGFAAETENVAANAKAKLAAKGCDWILANDVSPQTGIMGGDRNTIELVTAQGVEPWPPQSKEDVAAMLIARIARDSKRNEQKFFALSFRTQPSGGSRNPDINSVQASWISGSRLSRAPV